MNYSSQVWSQIRNITAKELRKALERDGWILDEVQGNGIAYYWPGRSIRVTVHYHPGKTFGPRMLKELLNDIGWTEDDLRRLKLIS